MPFLKTNEQNLAPTGPRVNGAGPGEVAVITLAAASGFVDLSTIGHPAFDQRDEAKSQVPGGAVGRHVTISADIDIGFFLGPDKAGVTTHVPSLTAVGAIDAAGKYTNADGTCKLLKANTEARFFVQPGSDNFLGWIAAGAGKLRIHQSSPTNT